MCFLNNEVDSFVVHERDDWVFMLLRDTCLPANLVTTLAHYPSDVKKKKKNEVETNVLLVKRFSDTLGGKRVAHNRL